MKPVTPIRSARGSPQRPSGHRARPVEAGLPVTDMSLGIADADLQPQQEHAITPVPQHSSPDRTVEPKGQPTVKPAPTATDFHHDHHDC